MTKKWAPQRTTKKHLARADRERIQSRWLLGVTIAIALVAIGILGYGLFDSAYLQPKKTIAIVNGDTITKGEFHGRIRILQRELIGQLNSYVQMEQFFASDPQTLASIRELQNQIQTQLAYPEIIGQVVINSMIRETLLRQEAEGMGIHVLPVEVERQLQNSFGFYPDGTPTPIPTLTPDPTRMAEIAAASEPTAGPSPTSTLPQTPNPTATPYVLEAYEDDYALFLDSLSDFDISESDFNAYVEAQLLEEKLREQFQPEIDSMAEHVLIQHIFTFDEEIAQEALEQLESGGIWDDIVLEYSEDPSSREFSGDLGWNTLNDLVALLGQMGITAFSAPVMEDIGPIESQQGWHILRVIDRQDREISQSTYQEAVDNAFEAWVYDMNVDAEITVVDDWQDHLPPSGPLGI
ncbi:MAG: SurA N-terminal domain-containing protein [Anaerolineales bacterium]|nr:SurA N-terminal domain-containing protein [Anaerolineales bacterium]